MRLSDLIIISFVLVGLIGSLVGGALYFNSSQDLMRESISDSLLAVAESRADHVETYFKQNIERLKLVASRTKLRNTLKQYSENPNQADVDTITGILNDAKKPIEEFERICILSLDGIVVASTNEGFCGKDVSDKKFFLEAKEKESINFVEENGELKIFISGPLSLDGEIIGVGLTVVDNRELKKIIKDGTGLGETGEVLVATLVADERIYLFERLFEDEALMQQTESAVSAEPMRQALGGNEISFDNALDYRDEPVMAVSQYIAVADMGLVAKIDRAEVLGAYQQLLVDYSIMIGALIIIISIIIGFFVSRLISKPIKSLIQTVDTITKGQLDIQLNKSNIAEIQSLNNSLNRVLASLKLAVLRGGTTKDKIGLGEILQARKEAEETYKLLYESSSDAIMILSPPDWRFVEANPATIKLFKAKNEEEFITKTPGDISPKKQPDGKLSSQEAKKMIEKAMNEGSASFNWVHKTLAGEEFNAHVLLTKFTLNEKDLLHATVRQR
jgi:methyl-accepting chemotaxis protein